VDALSSKRHYVPSLLILRWVNEERQDKDKDKDKVVVNDEFMSMVRSLFFLRWLVYVYGVFFGKVKNYVDASVFSGFETMGMVKTVDLDQALSETLQGIDLDVQGRLVKSMTVRGKCFSLSLCVGTQ